MSASPTQGAIGHRSLTLVFTLAGGGEPCTLTGYPGVDAGAGEPPIHAQPTLRGYMGGLPADVYVPPTVVLSLSMQAQAILEGMAVDAGGNQCPSYTDLAVNPPEHRPGRQGAGQYRRLHAVGTPNHRRATI